LNPFDLVAVHGISPGGEAFMPVWGHQVNFCGVHGTTINALGETIAVRSWTATTSPDGKTIIPCTPTPFDYCSGIQSSDEADFSPPSCDRNEGCGDNGDNVCVADFSSAWPTLDKSTECQVLSHVICPLAGSLCGLLDPSRIDYPNNVIVYRAPINWENHSDEGADDDYTWDMHSPGSELYDTQTGGRIHVEFDADETIDHFIPDFDSSKCFASGSTTPNPPVDASFGLANLWWRKLRCFVDQNPNVNDEQTDRDIRCWLKQIVNPNLTCPPSGSDEPTGPDPLAVVVGVPSMDCADNPNAGTDEIHPAYAMAIRIQEDPSKPEQWAFFYRNGGDNGGCGTYKYYRCDTSFKLPLGLPVVPAGRVLTSLTQVDINAHSWATDDSTPAGAKVTSSFDLTNGTVLTIALPQGDEGVVGLVTVTPKFDTTPPQIICPANITQPVDLGKCTALTTFTPNVSDNCSVSSACSTPSGSAFPLGTTTDTCTATDQTGMASSCSFNVTITTGNKCPQAQGYWKKHTDVWAVSSLTLGGVPYDKNRLIGILNSSSTGDASIILAKAEIGALLNLANGSSPVPACGAIADADSALNGCAVPCMIGPKTVTGQSMNGKLTPGCTP
jgi:hypothetical protein